MLGVEIGAYVAQVVHGYELSLEGPLGREVEDVEPLRVKPHLPVDVQPEDAVALERPAPWAAGVRPPGVGAEPVEAACAAGALQSRASVKKGPRDGPLDLAQPILGEGREPAEEGARPDVSGGEEATPARRGSRGLTRLRR